MKKLLLSLITITAFGFGADAQNVNIPDANFKAYLIGNSAINTNADTEITVSEAAAFTGHISCGGLSISDLTGIEAFVNIFALQCLLNNLTTLDISANTKIITLVASENQLTSITLPPNGGLIETLSLSENNFTTLSLSNMDSLGSLLLHTNQLTSLSLTNIPNLGVLHCDNNNLSSLDLSNFPALYYFGCNNNSLTSLNVAHGNNINFYEFKADNNPNLTCIQVDDATYSNSNWNTSNFSFDSISNFNENCGIVGVNEIINKNNISVYPNPASSQLSINTGASTIESILVIDITGKTIKSIIPTNNTIDVSDLTEGIFILQVKTEEGVFTNKFIKE